jgi:hypothetical protein
MFYAKLHADGTIARYPYAVTDLRMDTPNTSFPANPSDETLAEFGVVPVSSTAQPAYNDVTQVLQLSEPVFDSGAQRWVQVWAVRELTAEELQQRFDAQAKAVRAERNTKLAACDWTQLADATADKPNWATYRQALRDVTAQSGFPWTIDWPVQP